MFQCWYVCMYFILRQWQYKFKKQTIVWRRWKRVQGQNISNSSSRLLVMWDKLSYSINYIYLKTSQFISKIISGRLLVFFQLWFPTFLYIPQTIPLLSFKNYFKFLRHLWLHHLFSVPLWIYTFFFFVYFHNIQGMEMRKVCEYS